MGRSTNSESNETIRTCATPSLRHGPTTMPLRRSGELPSEVRDIRLLDGARLRLRAMLPGDREQLKALLARCSPEAIRFRFLLAINWFSDALLDQLTAIDGLQHVALAVTQGEGAEEQFLAEGRYAVLPEKPRVAQIALLVADEWQRRGIGTRLFSELVEIARRRCLTHFSADVLADNRAVLSLLRKTGYVKSARASYGVAHLELPLAQRESLIELKAV